MRNRRFDDCVFFLSCIGRGKKAAGERRIEKMAVQIAQFCGIANLQVL